MPLMPSSPDSVNLNAAASDSAASPVAAAPRRKYTWWFTVSYFVFCLVYVPVTVVYANYPLMLLAPLFVGPVMLLFMNRRGDGERGGLEGSPPAQTDSDAPPIRVIGVVWTPLADGWAAPDVLGDRTESNP